MAECKHGFAYLKFQSAIFMASICKAVFIRQKFQFVSLTIVYVKIDIT